MTSPPVGTKFKFTSWLDKFSAKFLKFLISLSDSSLVIVTVWLLLSWFFFLFKLFIVNKYHNIIYYKTPIIPKSYILNIAFVASILFSVTLVSIVDDRLIIKSVNFAVKSAGSAVHDIFKSSIADIVLEFIVMSVEFNAVIDESSFTIVEFNVLTLLSTNWTSSSSLYSHSNPLNPCLHAHLIWLVTTEQVLLFLQELSVIQVNILSSKII